VGSADGTLRDTPSSLFIHTATIQLFATDTRTTVLDTYDLPGPHLYDMVTMEEVERISWAPRRDSRASYKLHVLT
jgi:hypothetical protein